MRLVKYLKDQGGQFWGAFGQAYANALEKAKDRPLKEAMMKAELGQKQAQMKKMEFDMQQAQQHQVALDELSSVLQPQQVTTSTPTEGPATEAGVGPAPHVTTEMKMPDIKSPKVQGALIKAQPKEAATQLLKQSTMQPMTVLAQTWEEAAQIQNDPAFQRANPYGGRWIQTKNGLQFQGIHPVNPEAALFHGPQGRQGAIDYAYERSATTGAGSQAGRTAQEIQQPIPARVPFAGQQPVQGATPGFAGGAQGVPGTQPAPSPGASSNSLPGETPAMTATRLKKEASTAGSPIPEGLAKQQREYVTLLNTTIADIEGNLDETFLGKRGLPGVQQYRESFLAPALEGVTGVTPAGEREVIFRKALKDASDQLLRTRSGAQINEAEAKRLAAILPNATDHPEAFRAGFARFKHQVEQSIANGKLFANVTRREMESIGTGEKSPTPISGSKLADPPKGWKFK